MKYREFPGTDLKVSEIGFGVWSVATGWWGKIEEKEAIRLLQRARDLGITYFDTADTYGAGYGEAILARAFPDGRDKIVIGTKFGYAWQKYAGSRAGHKELPQDFSAAAIRKACEESLRRLNTDHLDLYQLHNPRLWHVESEEVWRTLEDLRREGKVRYFGAALGPDIGWLEEGRRAMQREDCTALQIIYSILEQEPARRMFGTARNTRTGLLVRVPHASDVLTDRPRSAFEASDHRSHRKNLWMEAALQARQKLDFLRKPIRGTERTLGQAAIQFCLAEPMTMTVLPNFTTEAELEEYAAASDLPGLTVTELQMCMDLYDRNFDLPPERAASFRQEFKDSRSSPGTKSEELEATKT